MRIPAGRGRVASGGSIADMEDIMGIRYTGFADEAAAGIRGQIEATKRLGWASIESRAIDGVNLTDIGEAEFDEVEAALSGSGVRIDCFGSAVANWGKDPRKDEDFGRSVAELSRAIPRMKRLGTTMLRGMSYGIVREAPPDDPGVAKLVISRLLPLVRMCEEAGVLYLHENCMNYGGQSPDHTMRLLEAIDSPAFGLIYDMGNPPFSFDRRGPEPWKLQSSWEFYERVKPSVKHVHIKDCVYIGPSEGIFPKARFTMPGEGDGDVLRIVEDIVKSGYDGFLSIEPHTETVFHEASGLSPEASKMAAYVEYGKRLMEIVAAAGG
jgi:sugar phosphate isomerase/epimerase